MTQIAALLRLSRAGPFEAERVGRRMAALYRTWDAHRGQDLPALARCLLQPLDVAGEPIGMACLAAAAAVARWGGPAYHSALHHAEVAVNAAVLATSLDEPLPAQDYALLLMAALSHDYLHRADDVPFAAEHLSADAVDAIARGCGAGRPDRDALRGLILATAPCVRPALASGAAGLMPQALRHVLASPRLAALAALLSDADLLSSAGLSVRWQIVQHTRLERELGRSMTHREDLAFLDHLVGASFISAPGRRFTPNLLRIRAACAERASMEP